MENHSQFEKLIAQKAKAQLQVYTLGKFEVSIDGQTLAYKDWGRDKTLQLFQYMVIARNFHNMHKEQIIDRLWEDSKNGESDFKVALHGINKILEPNRPSRTEPKFILRQGISYRLNFEHIYLDVEAMDQFIHLANICTSSDSKLAIDSYRQAIALYGGQFLPDRIYEDWTSAERERIQLSAMNAHLALAELLIDSNPNESIELAQNVLRMDETWEDAHRLLMMAYLKKGNRPQALKCYEICKTILLDAFGIGPLPETNALYKEIKTL